MSLDDLLFVQRMVRAGTEISRETWVRVLEKAIELAQPKAQPSPPKPRVRNGT